MTVAQIKLRIANLFHKTVGDFSVNGEDMLLTAMNAAKLLAEQTHDFEKSKRLVQLVLSSPQGAALSTATLYGTNTAVAVKSILNAGIVGTDGSIAPIDFRKRDSVLAEMRKVNRLNPLDNILRYPDEAWEGYATGVRELMQWGDQVLLRPMVIEGSLTIVCEAYTNMPDYTSTGTYTDFFTDFGHNYLVWQSVVELNHYFKTFIARQEGNVNPPEKLAQQALLSLINWDVYLIAQGTDVDAD